MSTIVITKGKILKDSVEVFYVKRDKENNATNCNEESKAPPHPDLQSAFNSLAVHAAIIGDFIESSSIADIENPEHPLLEKFVVTGFTIQGGEDMKGIILAAHKVLSTGKSLGFNTPSISFNDESPNAYERLTELFQCIETCRQELKLYLSGKHGAEAQTEIEFPEGENNSDDLEDGETNDAAENARIAKGFAGAAQKGRKKKEKAEA